MMGKHSTGKLGETKSGAQKVQRSHSSQGELGGGHCNAGAAGLNGVTKYLAAFI